MTTDSSIEWEDGDDQAMYERGAVDAYSKVVDFVDQKLKENWELLQKEPEDTYMWDYLSGTVVILEILKEKFAGETLGAEVASE